MGCPRLLDGATIQWNRLPSLHGFKCFQSWNSEMVSRERIHTHQCSILKHGTSTSDSSLSESAQYPRSRHRLV